MTSQQQPQAFLKYWFQHTLKSISLTLIWIFQEEGKYWSTWVDRAPFKCVFQVLKCAFGNVWCPAIFKSLLKVHGKIIFFLISWTDEMCHEIWSSSTFDQLSNEEWVIIGGNSNTNIANSHTVSFAKPNLFCLILWLLILVKKYVSVSPCTYNLARHKIKSCYDEIGLSQSVGWKVWGSC